MHCAVNIGGIPHLAKNQRDVGTPALVRKPEFVIGVLTHTGRQSMASLSSAAPTALASSGLCWGCRPSWPRNGGKACSVITTLYYYKPALHYPRVVVTPAGNGMLLN